MTKKDRNTLWLLIGLSHNELDVIKDAVQNKYFGFARTAYDRLQTDLAVLNNLIQKEG